MEQTRIQGKHAGLQRDQILRTALALVDRDGVSGLSMRRLARELGIEAMTLYHHVKNKDALEDALVEHVLAEYVTAESIHRIDGRVSWQDALKGYARDFHHALESHPGAVALFATRSAITSRNLRALEMLIGTLVNAGFTSAQALRIVHATAIAVIGQHATARHDVGADLESFGEDLPLVREAFGTDWSDLEARVNFMVSSLVAGYDRYLSGTSGLG